MGRKRKTRSHLPERVYWQNGAFRYQPPPFRDEAGNIVKPSQIRLGKNEAEMWRAWHDLGTAPPVAIRTMGQLFDSYAREVIPTRHPTSAKDDQAALKWLRTVFSDSELGTIRQTDLYRYLRERKAKTRANREMACLSNVFKHGIVLGIVDDNPTLGVSRNKEAPRERLPENWELEALMGVAGDMLRAYIPLKLLLGWRQGDMLNLRKDAIRKDGDGIYVKEGKRGKRRVLLWTQALRDAVAAAEAVPRPVGSMYLFSTRDGQKYTSDGFRSIWSRAMRKAIDSKVLVESFHEHDIRATTATEAGERARELLDHSSQKTTEIYLRSKEPKKVRPLR